jgi:hypothetical protein
MLRLFKGDEEVLHLVESKNVNCEYPNEHKVPVEMLQLLHPPSVPPSKLKVKLGCPLSVLQNLSMKRGLCNSISVRPTRVKRQVLQVQLLDGR